MSDEVSWSAPSGAMKFRHAVLYDSNPTIGEETTVTLVDADGNVESFTSIAVEPDDWDDWDES